MSFNQNQGANVAMESATDREQFARRDLCGKRWTITLKISILTYGKRTM